MTDEKMSSDSEEQDLAGEALAATADDGTPSAEKPDEPTVPLHEHTALRTRAQRAEIAEANALGRLEAMEQAQTKAAPSVKSPLDVEIARQAAEGIADEDMTISPRVIRAQELHNKQIANQVVKDDAARALAIQQVASKNKAMVEHEDWHQVIAAGEHFLTAAEIAFIGASGNDFGEACYTKCQDAAERNKPVKTATAPEKKPDESEAEKKAAEEKVPTQEEILAEVGGEPDAVRASQL